MTTEIKQCWRVGDSMFDFRRDAEHFARKQEVRHWISVKMDFDILVTDAETVAQWIVDNYDAIKQRIEGEQ